MPRQETPPGRPSLSMPWVTSLDGSMLQTWRAQTDGRKAGKGGQQQAFNLWLIFFCHSPLKVKEDESKRILITTRQLKRISVFWRQQQSLAALFEDSEYRIWKQMASSSISKSFTLSYLVTLWSWALNQVNMFAEGQHTYYSCPISLKAKNRNVIGQLRISGGAGIYYVFHCGRSLLI